MTVRISDIEAAAKAIAGDVIRIPTVASPALSREAGCELTLKLESLQLTGSFKARGDGSAASRRSPERTQPAHQHRPAARECRSH